MQSKYCYCKTAFTIIIFPTKIRTNKLEKQQLLKSSYSLLKSFIYFKTAVI